MKENLAVVEVYISVYTKKGIPFIDMPMSFSRQRPSKEHLCLRFEP